MSATTLSEPLSWSMRLLERNLVPDFLVRQGIRRLLRARLAEENRGGPEAQQQHLMGTRLRSSNRMDQDKGSDKVVALMKLLRACYVGETAALCVRTPA